jgi:hypothetical protein
MEDRPARWWSVLTVRDERVVAIEDHACERDAVRALERPAATERLEASS